MKKYFKYFILLCISLGIVFGIVNNHKIIDEYQSTNQILLANADTHNKALFAKVKTLQDYAKSFIAEKGSTKEVVQLCLDFIRKDAYNDYMWQMTIGKSDEEFIAYVASKDSSFKFLTTENIIDKYTGQEVEFIHLVAALSANYKPNGYVDPSYAGWSGDLMTILEEFVIYRTKNNITDNDKLKKYAWSIIGKDTPSTMGSGDALANLDSLTLLNSSNFRDDFYQTLIDYYVTNNGTYCSKNRFANAQKSLGSRSKLKETAIDLIGDKDIQTLLIPDTASKVTSNDLSIVAEAWVDYVYKEPYITLGSTNEVITSGSTNKVTLSGDNTDNITLAYDKEIVSVSKTASAISIKGLKAGTTTIKITSTSSKAEKGTIAVEVKNVAPAIKTDLEPTVTGKLDANVTLKFTADGTNNIYTWYTLDEETQTWKEHSVTEKPELSIKATLENKGKFFKCSIKNDGNEEIFTQQTMLSIEGLDPVIETDLPTDSTINYGESITLSFVISGDDNTYTWYLSDTLDDNGNEYKVTEKPEITIDGTEDINNKYLKCIITNTKTGKAVTSAVKLTVEGIPVVEKPPVITPGDDPKDEGSILPFIIVGVVAVLVIAIVVIIVVKKKKKTTDTPNDIQAEQPVVENNESINNEVTEVNAETVTEVPTEEVTPVVEENVVSEIPYVEPVAEVPTEEVAPVVEENVVSEVSYVEPVAEVPTEEVVPVVEENVVSEIPYVEPVAEAPVEELAPVVTENVVNEVPYIEPIAEVTTEEVAPTVEENVISENSYAEPVVEISSSNEVVSPDVVEIADNKQQTTDVINIE